MQRMRLIVIASILITGVGAGCLFNAFKELNEDYCRVNFGALNPSEKDQCCREYPGQCEPGGGMCQSSDDCASSFETPFCRVDKEVCVQCLENAHCTELQPICDDQTNTCVECRGSADCASGLCLDSGSCAAATNIVYVSDTNALNNPMCSQDMPCQDLVQALTVVTPERKYISVTGNITNPAVAIFEAVTVEIYGTPGASSITRTGMGDTLEVKKAAKVNLVDLEIVGGPMGAAVWLRDNPQTAVSMTRVKVRAPNGDGILISDGKLTMSDSEVFNSSLAGVSLVKGSLVMDQSRVVNNLQDGVVKTMAGTVEIRRSLIYGNKGTAGVFTTGASMVTIESSVIATNTGTAGGVSIAGPLSIKNSVIARNGGGTTTVGGLTLNSANATFEFNTVADNLSTGNLGMSCVAPFAVSNSIITGNTVNGCNVTYSLADTVLPGNGNMAGVPMFMNTDATDPASSTFYRIMAGSPARDMADPAATLSVDIDGDPRPVMGKDMGADEFKQAALASP